MTARISVKQESSRAESGILLQLTPAYLSLTSQMINQQAESCEKLTA